MSEEISKIQVFAPEILLTAQGPAKDHVLAFTRSEIVFVGTISEFREIYPDATIEFLPGKAIIPGLIDAHVHLGQGFGKGLAAGEPAQIWRRIWGALEQSLDPHTVYISAKWMLLEALRGGFTGIVNFAIYDEERMAAINLAACELGIRLVGAAGAVEPVDLPDMITTKERNDTIDRLITRGEYLVEASRESPLITPSICLSGVQGASPELIQEAIKFCNDQNILFQIHTNEHHVEVHWSVERYGKRPLEVFAEAGATGCNTLHHHCTLVTDQEIELLAETQSGVSYNPLASSWKGDRVAPALAFAARNIRFGLGTDSTRMDGFRLLECAETVQRLTSGMGLADFSCGAAWNWIDRAMKGSADVAGLGDVTGSLEIGKKADFLILDCKQPEVLPGWDFEWDLLRLYNRDQIESVFIDGQHIMQKGRVLDWDQDEFIARHLEPVIAKVRQAPIRKLHPVSSSLRGQTNNREVNLQKDISQKNIEESQ